MDSRVSRSVSNRWVMTGGAIILAALTAWVTAGCRTIPRMAPINTAEPGWKVQQGQAVWKASSDAPEIAGELLLATHDDGRTFLEFTKNPIPFVTVLTSNELWQIDFVPRSRRFSGKGSPGARLIWVHLARALHGEKPKLPLTFEKPAQGEWKIENRSTGEFVSGYITP